MIDGFDRLRHHAIVGGDYQDDDVGRLGAPRAHLGKRGVARGIDEGDPVAGRQGDLIGADVLGDAARLVRRDIALAQGVEQRGLAVVDVAHDGNHRRPPLQLLILVDLALQANLDVGGADPPDVVAELDGQKFSRIGVEDVIDGGHDPHLHQRLDHVGRTRCHPAGELLDGQRLRNDHVANHLYIGTLHLKLLQTLFFAGAPDRSQAAHPLRGVVQRVDDVDFAAPTRVVATPGSIDLAYLDPGRSPRLPGFGFLFLGGQLARLQARRFDGLGSFAGNGRYLLRGH